MISPISTKSGTATSVNELVVFQTMSPRVLQRRMPDARVTPRIPTSPITEPIATPNTSNATSTTMYSATAICQDMALAAVGQDRLGDVRDRARRAANQRNDDLMQVQHAQPREGQRQDQLRHPQWCRRGLDR